MSGARTFTILHRILLPLIRPSALFLLLWTLLFTLREVSLALFLTGPHNQVLLVSIFQLWQGGQPGPAAAAAVALVGLLMVLVLPFVRMATGSMWRTGEGRRVV
jgi:ABC-type Fe3+ transport system permease subunit